jgi:hypothetical protein
MIHRPYPQCTKYTYPVGILSLLAVLVFISCSRSPVSGEKQGEIINKEQKEIPKRVQESQEALRKSQEAIRKKEEAMQEKISRLNAEVEVARKRVGGRQAQAKPSSVQEMGTQGSDLFMQKNTAAQFVTRSEDNDDQLSVSSEGENVLTLQELLEMKLRDSEAVLTPNQSITLLSHCAELGEQDAALAAEKTVSIFAGNTGAGKSTTLNALLGCQMKVVRSRELGLPGARKMIVVDPESPREEVMPIGHHGRQSQTFLPKIVQTPDEPSSAYYDCPGFSDTRGAEINIANAINIRKILQQATGVKAVFLASYYGLLVDRDSSSIRHVETMCRKMFGSVDSLKRYQNSVLLGITKAPLCENGEPLTTDTVRELLTSANSDIATILANRIFLFDPLDRGSNNNDFWSIERCRTEIARLEHIPQQLAKNLFQTTLTDGDQVHLLTIVRRLRPKMVNAITQGDVTALGQHWQLLQRLRVVKHSEVDQLIEEEVLPAINVALQKLGDIGVFTDQYNFDQAEANIAQLTQLIQQLPGAEINVDLAALHQLLENYRGQHAQKQQAEEQRQQTEEELN